MPGTVGISGQLKGRRPNFPRTTCRATCIGQRCARAKVRVSERVCTRACVRACERAGGGRARVLVRVRARVCHADEQTQYRKVIHTDTARQRSKNKRFPRLSRELSAKHSTPCLQRCNVKHDRKRATSHRDNYGFPFENYHAGSDHRPTATLRVEIPCREKSAEIRNVYTRH